MQINKSIITAQSKAAPHRRSMAVVSLTAALSSSWAMAQGQSAGTTSQVYAAGRILVMPRAGMPDAAMDKILNENGGGKAHRVGKSELRIVDLRAGTESAMVAKLKRHPHIKFVELDQRLTPALTPNDPYLGSQWHLATIGAPVAWDSSQGAGVKVAILDTGVDGTHPDLAARLVPGWNFYDNNSNTSDVNGHGTIVAGAAAATDNNGLGVASVAGQALIMPVRIADPSAYAYWSTVAQGINWAADNGAKVANLSYGGAAGSSTVQSAAQYLKSKGGLLVVSAGNNGIDENITPTTTMIPVSATDSTDTKTSWSSYGGFVAVAAPGAGIYSTSRGGGYMSASGTSVAAPVTAGVIALMMAANPKLTNADVESLLYKTAVDLGAPGRDPLYGYGRVSADAAVKAALTTITTADTQAPTVSILSPLGSTTVSGLAMVDVVASDNIGVTKVELRVNGAVVATDTASPYGFSWDTTTVANGMANVVAIAHDAAGNVKTSATVSVNVSNATVPTTVDLIPPVVNIANPTAGTKVNGNILVSVTASDNSGAAGISQTVYIDGVLKASGSGGNLSFNWNTRKAAAGTHTIQAAARDAAGNTSTYSVQVIK